MTLKNRTIVVSSDYSDGDTIGPYKKASSSDVIVNGNGIAISNIFYTYSTKISDYPLSSLDYCVLADASSNNITITLPTAIDNSGRVFLIKRIDSGGGNKTVTVTSSVNIDNQSGGIALDPYASIFVVSDNSKWWII